MTWDWLKDLAAKAITVGVIAVAGEVLGGASPLEYKLLAMVFGYAVWTQIIVPKVNVLLNPQITATKGIAKKSRFALI